MILFLAVRPLLCLLLLLLLAPLLPFGLIACVGSRLFGLSRVMLLFSILVVATWSSSSVFTSFYLTDVGYSFLLRLVLVWALSLLLAMWCRFLILCCPVFC